MDFYKGTIPILDPEDAAATDTLNPADQMKGYVPRDYDLHPEEMFAPPSELKVYDTSEWDERYNAQKELKSSLEHWYLSGPNNTPIFDHLDQNGQGYCWAYSTGHALMFDRLRRGLPMIRLSPHAVACKIKNF